MAHILFVDDEENVRLVLQDILERSGHTTVGASNAAEAIAALAREKVELIVSDYRMPGLTGLDLLELIREKGHDQPLIMLTGHATIEHAVAAIKAGAADYITKPIQPEQLEHAIAQALELARLKQENEALRSEVMEVRAEREIIARTEVMRLALQTVSTIASTRATVLLQGESGTGKELFARAIHNQSDRRAKPFVKLNCAAMPEGLVESALFGHERGAFTGAIKRVEGAFERADGGTLLLDEITEMRADLQGKLLRVLQEHEFERVGGNVTIKVDVRIIATTNRDISAAVDRGEFRGDLFYRLAVMPIRVPPLRERRDDIPMLAHHFAMHAAQELNKDITGIGPDALALLQQYDWPGNVRELQHAVDRAVILTQRPMLSASSFDTIRGKLATPSALPALTVDDDRSLVLRSLNVEAAEAALIERALVQTGGNRTRAAELLGVSVRTLRSKLAARRDGGMKS